MDSIKNDHNRFKNIIKGKLKKSLKDYIQNGQRIVQKGKDTFSVPMPRIDQPRFTHGYGKKQGVGQGDGQGDGQGQGKPGQGEAGNQEGDKLLEAQFTGAELAELLGEELELPKIEPKGENNIKKKIFRYNTLGLNGPESLRNMKKTFFNSIKRQIGAGEYDPKKPTFMPRRQDFRYRSFTVDYEYDSSATVFYIMDVSGSMGQEQKEMARTASFWKNAWLKANYKDIKIRYIIHDSSAKEVDEKTFFSTQESGGTLISSSYKLVKEIIEHEKIMDNIYIFQYSDGDNWSGEDTKICLDLLENFFLKTVNLFGYAQTTSKYGSGDYLRQLDKRISHEDFLVDKMESTKDAIKVIKNFLGKGK